MSASARAVLPLRSYKGRGFAINLIHREAVSFRVDRILAGAVLGCLVMNAAILLSFLRDAALAEAQGHQIQMDLQQQASAVTLAALNGEMEALDGQAKEEINRFNAVIAHHQQRFSVGGRLAVLVKTLPERTWITGLSGDRERRVVTIGVSYLIDPEASNLLPAEGWIQTLKADPLFGQGLKRLEATESSRQAQQGKAQRIDYKLVAEW